MDVVLSCQKLGASKIIGIHGPNQEIVERYHWLFVNHGATLGKLYFFEKSPLDNFTGIFHATILNLKKAFRSMERIKLEKEFDESGELEKNKKNKDFTKKFQELLLKGARLREESLMPRTDLCSRMKEENVKIKYLKEYEY